MARHAARSAAVYGADALSRRRLAAIGAVALALAPTTFWRDPPPGDDLADFRAVALDFAQPAGWPDGLELVGAWELQAENSRFGGFSALARDDERGFLAWSDRGDLVRMDHPEQPGASAHFLPLPGSPEFAYAQDIEAVVRDPQGGTMWLAHENPNAIRRLRNDAPEKVVRFDIMRGWHPNLGLEAMVRLADGRFLALRERGDIAMIFPGDPADRVSPEIIALDVPAGWRPSDAALLPDGRVLVLLRAVRRDWPPFRTMLALGDPAALAQGEPWTLSPLATLDEHALVENYEGLAVTPHDDGRLAIYLVSDDNQSALQRTLLLELHWTPQTQAAREAGPRAPPSASVKQSP